MTDSSEKTFKIDRHRRMRIRMIVIILIIIVLLPLSIWIGINTNGHLMLRKAKDIRLNLILTGIDYSGEGKSVYDSTTKDGFSDGALEYVTSAINEDLPGEIVLTSWNDSDNSPRTFSYREGSYHVEYTGNRKDADFKVYYDWNILSYKADGSAES